MCRCVRKVKSVFANWPNISMLRKRRAPPRYPIRQLLLMRCKCSRSLSLSDPADREQIGAAVRLLGADGRAVDDDAPLHGTHDRRRLLRILRLRRRHRQHRHTQPATHGVRSYFYRIPIPWPSLHPSLLLRLSPRYRKTKIHWKLCTPPNTVLHVQKMPIACLPSAY